MFPFVEGSIGSGIVFLLLGGLFLLFSFALKPPASPISIDKLRGDAIQYIHASRDSGEFAVIPTSLMLPAGEKCHLQQLKSVLSEPKTISKRVGSSRVRIAKGVYIGKSSSHTVSHQELLPVDNGELVLTNKNLYFKGQLNVRTITLSKIISLELVSMGYNTFAIELGEAKKQKKETLQVDNPFLWASMIKIFKAMEEDKVPLKQMQFDI